jgi:hypothetical protein
MTSQIAWPPAPEAAVGGKVAKESISASPSANLATMSALNDRAIAALEALPEEMRERAVEFLEDQAEKLQVMRRLVQEGLDDIEAGRVQEWNLEHFLAEARGQILSD